MPDINAATNTIQINGASDTTDVEIAADTFSAHADLAWEFEYDAIKKIDAVRLASAGFLPDRQS